MITIQLNKNQGRGLEIMTLYNLIYHPRQIRCSSCQEIILKKKIVLWFHSNIAPKAKDFHIHFLMKKRQTKGKYIFSLLSCAINNCINLNSNKKNMSFFQWKTYLWIGWFGTIIIRKNYKILIMHMDIIFRPLDTIKILREITTKV